MTQTLFLNLDLEILAAINYMDYLVFISDKRASATCRSTAEPWPDVSAE